MTAMPHLELVRFITSRQAALRGLREVTIAGSGLIVMMLTLSAGAGLLAVVFWIFAAEVLLRFVDWRYDATYGRVARTWRSLGRSTRCQMLLSTGVLLDGFLPWFPLAGHSAFPILVSVYALWIVARDFPWRGYYLAAVLLAFVAPPVDDPSRMINYFPAYAAGLASIAVTGLLDHVLLMAAFARLKANGQTVEVPGRT
jgi:hypothetical protein